MIKELKKKISRWMDFNPPGALSSKGWRLFNEEFKEKAPIRYWVQKDFHRAVILPIKWKYEKITSWIIYRTYRRYHIVSTGLPPGWNDVSQKLLYTSFTMLKDFVEVELAWRTYAWSDDYKEKASWFEKHMPFYRVIFPFRSPEYGIKHLEWASTLDDPSLPPHERCDHQAVSSREIKELYKWWVNKRPARKDLEYLEYNDQGFGFLASLDDDFDRDAEDFKKSRASMEQQSKLDEEWANEDDEMLIRLMKVRHHLWT
jgi:hypothetical protein